MTRAMLDLSEFCDPYVPKHCNDCGVEEGGIHEFGCDHENCPFCGDQLVSYECASKLLGFDYDWNARLCGMPENLTDHWIRELEHVGRIPYIHYPLVCAYCGKLYPEFFMVPDAEWTRYIEPRMQDKILCLECYNHIKGLIDNADINPCQTPT